MIYEFPAPMAAHINKSFIDLLKHIVHQPYKDPDNYISEMYEDHVAQQSKLSFDMFNKDAVKAFRKGDEERFEEYHIYTPQVKITLSISNRYRNAGRVPKE